MTGRLIVLVSICLCAGTAVVDAKKAWEQQKGRNFTVYYCDVSPDFVQTVMDEAEENLSRVRENLGITHYESWWNKRSSIYIYRDEADYVQNGGQAGWSHGAALVETKTIKTYPSANGFFDSMLPHELGHIVLHELIGPTAVIPLWFDEGVAMYQEKARRPGAHQTVKKAIKNGQFIPLTQLADMRLYKVTDDAAVELFYAEAASAVNFMITQLGERHFYKLCKELKEQIRFEDALSQAYTRIKNLDDLNTMWVKFLEEQ